MATDIFSNLSNSWDYGANYTIVDENNSDTVGNGTEADTPFDFFITSTKAVLLGLMILITVIGNVFVIAAILLERNLQNVANYLIVSLAVADLMVACLVMPLAAVYEISKGWILGPELCDIWTSSDVLCCTASILHLLAIAVDRYWAVTNVDYIHSRNVNRIGFMIAVIWIVALVVSLAQFGWKNPGHKTRITEQKRCLPNQDITYQVFATCSSFFVPLFIILILYWKIFQTARKRIRKNRKPRMAASANAAHPPITTHSLFSKKRFRRLRKGKQSSAAEALVSSLALVEGQSTTTVDAVVPDDVTETQKTSDASGDTVPAEDTSSRKNSRRIEPTGEEETTTAFTISQPDSNLPQESINVSPEKSSDGTTNNGSASHQSHISDASRVAIIEPGASATTYGTTAADAVTSANAMQSRREKKESLEAKRERKAAKTLAIITGAFVVCWFPFFVLAVVMAFCDCVAKIVFDISLWLGYLNSTLNPVIYTIFSPEFRQAFKRMLCGAPRRNPYYCRDFAK